MNTAFLLIFATGEYENECKEWKQRTRATKTWANFKTDFMEAYKNRREIQKLQQQGSPAQLFGANITNNTPSLDDTTVTSSSTLTDAFSDTNKKISAIANVTLENGTQVAYLAQVNELPKVQVSNMQKLLTNIQETIIAKAKYLPLSPPKPPTTTQEKAANQEVTIQVVSIIVGVIALPELHIILVTIAVNQNQDMIKQQLLVIVRMDPITVVILQLQQLMMLMELLRNDGVGACVKIFIILVVIT